MKKIIIAILSLVACSLLLVGCDNQEPADTPNLKNEPNLVYVDNGEIAEKTICFSVGKDTDYVQLFDFIRATGDTIWKVMDIENNVFESKVVKVSAGTNVFYIEASLPNGTKSVNYTLNIFRSYDITVTYVWKEDGYREKILNTVQVKQGELFKADYVPEFYGYDFVSWHDYNSDVEFTEGKSSADFKLIAEVSPKPVTVHLIIDGEEWQTIQTKYNEYIKPPVPPDKEHYSFDDWYRDSKFTNSLSRGYALCNYLDVYFYGKLTPNQYNITYDFGIAQYTRSRSVKYGEDFEIVEPWNHHITVDGITYIFAGFIYNGEPFESGKYFYDGDITVEAVWIPEEEQGEN